MGYEVNGILGLIVLILDVYAIVKVLGSGATTGTKVLWIVLILVLPVLGVVLWWLFRPQRLTQATRRSIWRRPDHARPSRRPAIRLSPKLGLTAQ